ncbi:hypothetical protein C8R45DRAFT_1070469 [Mycena sanguinolenta]|nr:hypothetical protein C8R45DRAFT_1070469 [Mycena sanguinolenta]
MSTFFMGRSHFVVFKPMLAMGWKSWMGGSEAKNEILGLSLRVIFWLLRPSTVLSSRNFEVLQSLAVPMRALPEACHCTVLAPRRDPNYSRSHIPRRSSLDVVTRASQLYMCDSVASRGVVPTEAAALTWCIYWHGAVDGSFVPVRSARRPALATPGFRAPFIKTPIHTDWMDSSFELRDGLGMVYVVDDSFEHSRPRNKICLKALPMSSCWLDSNVFACCCCLWPSEIRGENGILKWISWNRKRHQTARPALFLFEWLYVIAAARNRNAISALPPLKRDPALFLALTPTFNPPTTRMSLKLKPLRLKTLIQSPPSEPPRNSFTSTDYYRKTRDEYYSPISYMESSSVIRSPPALVSALNLSNLKPGSPYADLPEISSPSSAGLGHIHEEEVNEMGAPRAAKRTANFRHPLYSGTHSTFLISFSASGSVTKNIEMTANLKPRDFEPRPSARRTSIYSRCLSVKRIRGGGDGYKITHCSLTRRQALSLNISPNATRQHRRTARVSKPRPIPWPQVKRTSCMENRKQAEVLRNRRAGLGSVTGSIRKTRKTEGKSLRSGFAPGPAVHPQRPEIPRSPRGIPQQWALWEWASSAGDVVKATSTTNKVEVGMRRARGHSPASLEPRACPHPDGPCGRDGERRMTRGRLGGAQQQRAPRKLFAVAVVGARNRDHASSLGRQTLRTKTAARHLVGAQCTSTLHPGAPQSLRARPSLRVSDGWGWVECPPGMDSPDGSELDANRVDNNSLAIDRDPKSDVVGGGFEAAAKALQKESWCLRLGASIGRRAEAARPQAALLPTTARLSALALPHRTLVARPYPRCQECALRLSTDAASRGANSKPSEKKGVGTGEMRELEIAGKGRRAWG